MKYLATILVVICLVSCEKEEVKFHVLQGEAFGTIYTIQFFSSEEFEVQKGIDSVIYGVNRSVSTYMPNSDISKVNRGDSTLVIDSIFKDVFRISEAVHKKSNGYFDPTIGVLRNAYGFGDIKALNKIDEKVLDSLMQFVGFDKVSITKNGTIKKENPNIYFDFNAVAKGYGIDCLGRYLEANKVKNYLIELGGEIRAKGKNISKKKPWIAGIESIHSELEDRNYDAKIRLENKSMASSGNYRKFRTDSLTGKKYVHTINPLTGSAEQSDITSASVVAETCAIADAYATTIMALGFEKAKVLLKDKLEIEAYFTYSDSLHTEQVYMTDGFRRLLVE
ncbi:FAD:protein FMN transferase [Ulvibacter antarcticus]|uniref:FAD:protein FMN transferase n=1 Tax=Ulvibacter antarcticus TaxID=442714 RepID=A0A3L9YE88_9FLAO|nr:FAD:protein FMN transferase [Ulvibacter antarcticus]RMA57767.1 thiamine biosynthesis lipoprotein [Ulvibacter antarcticus]